MTTPAWSDSCAADPEPDDSDNGPWCRTPGLLPEQREHMTTLDVQGDLL